ELPDARPRRFSRAAELRTGVPPKVGFDLHPLPPLSAGLPDANVWPMGGGTPDVKLVPVKALARAYRRALLQWGRRWGSVLDYGDARGHPNLREALARMLSAL